MKCHYCGTELAESALFCYCCGTKQRQPQEAEAIEIEFSAPAPELEDYLPELEGYLPELEDFGELPEEEKPPVTPPTELELALRRLAQRSETGEWDPYGEEPAKSVSQKKKTPPPARTRLHLPTDRSLAKMVILGLLTLGIYPLVVWSRLSTEINITASRYDGKRTMPFLGMVLLTPLTLGIYALVWHHRFAHRVGMELRRRKLDFTFDSNDFWLWNVLGTLILVGPFVYTFKIIRAFNQLNEHYNLYD